MDSKKIKMAVKVLLLVAMIGFFCPFALVSCSGDTIEATGVELMTKISFHEELEFEEDDPPNYYVLAAFVFSVTGLILAHCSAKDNKKMTASGVCSIGGIIALLVFRGTFMEFYDLTGYDGRITVEFRWGWILTLIAFICAAGGAFLYQHEISQNDEGSEQRERDSHPEGPHPVPPGKEPVTEPEPEEIPIVDTASPITDFPYFLFNGQTAEAPQKPTPTVMVHCSKDGQNYSFCIESYPCLIGRKGSSCDVKIEDSKASRVHAQLTLSGNEIYIEDMDSSNGTRVNGELISGPTQINPGDKVMIGTTCLSFETIDKAVEV